MIDRTRFLAVFARKKVLQASLFSLMTLMAGQSLALGIVSRSCLAAGAQESITVDWGFNSYWLWTASYHYRNGQQLHSVQGTWEYTWRSYAGHLGTEFWYGEVVGSHYQYINGQERNLGVSRATDCNLSNWGN